MTRAGLLHDRANEHAKPGHLGLLRLAPPRRYEVEPSDGRCKTNGKASSKPTTETDEDAPTRHRGLNRQDESPDRRLRHPRARSRGRHRVCRQRSSSVADGPRAGHATQVNLSDVLVDEGSTGAKASAALADAEDARGRRPTRPTEEHERGGPTSPRLARSVALNGCVRSLNVRWDLAWV